MKTVATGHDHASCQELLGQLSDYVDGELEEALCAELEAHLAGCPNCRVMVDTVRRTITLYSRQATTELPSEVEARLFRVLNLAK
jgi:anti-sigma factor (TIGR02949 family)